MSATPGRTGSELLKASGGMLADNVRVLSDSAFEGEGSQVFRILHTFLLRPELRPDSGLLPNSAKADLARRAAALHGLLC